MASRQTIYLIKKAGRIACFFLLTLNISWAEDIEWKFDSNLQKAYLSVLNLQTDLAYSQLARLPESSTNVLQKMYVQSFCETLDVLISEDAEKFNKIEVNFKERFKYLDGLKPSAETLFLKAELNLQRGFNFLNLGQELNAVFAIRTAYGLAEECLKKYPEFIPVKKTSGVIQVMLGSVPDKYHWFMSLLGMKGSVTLGQRQLQELRLSDSSLNMEATLLYFTIKGLINQQHGEAAIGILECLEEQPYNRLALFLGVNMLVKDSESEKALALIRTLDQHTNGLPMYYIDYLRGEILLQRGDYEPAIRSYKSFIQHYKSINFKKDSYFKISLCYWLQGNEAEAKKYFDIARKTGKDVAEPDRYAAVQLKEESLPNAKILKVRFFTDGGYYPQAKAALQDIKMSDLPSEKERAEYYYRKARLADKVGDMGAAKLFYHQTIDMTGTKPWYFGANSALQLGYIARQQNDFTLARMYFEKALSYKKHEYKNSIDSKARSALEQLPNGS